MRYLLVTELYMVDTWEKIVVHILFGIIFVMFWYFNYSIIVSGINQLRSSTAHDVEQILWAAINYSRDLKLLLNYYLDVMVG